MGRTPTVGCLGVRTTAARLLPGCALLCVVSGAQPPQAPTFSARSNLVLVRVVVRNRAGRTVGNLEKEDFQLFDKGQPQFISRFSVEGTAGRTAGTAQALLAPEKSPGAPLPPDRYLAYVFDDIHLKAGDLMYARRAAERHFSELPALSRAAIFTTSGRITLDFTDDAAKLRDTLRRIQPGATVSPTGMDCPDLSYYQADLIQNKNDQQAVEAAIAEAAACAQADPRTAEKLARAAASRIANLGEMETRQALGALDNVIRRLAAMPGQRSIVLVSPGFLVLEDRFREMEVMDRALRSSVTIGALDARGLFVIGAGSDAGSSYGSASPEAKDRYTKDSATVEGMTLGEIADATGGTFVQNTNDLEAGLKRIAAPPENYYLLGFSPQDLKFDGRYHNLKVSLVKNPGGYTVQARRGYFAPSRPVDAAAEAKREIQEALFSPDELHGLPAEVTAKVEGQKRSTPKLTVLVHLDAHTLQFHREGDRNVDTVVFHTALFDRDGKYVSGKESTVNLRLKDDSLQKLAESGIQVEAPFEVAPGTYRIREVVRDTESQQVAGLNYNITVTNAPVERKNRSMAGWTPAEFKAAIPALRALKAMEGQEPLLALLERVGANVKSYFDTFPDISAREQITLELRAWNDVVYDRKTEQFNYLDLSRPVKSGLGLEEYRTNSKGKRVEPEPLAGGFVTTGFTSMLAHFHPTYLPDSGFRYLGRERINNRDTEVVYFAQFPQKARVKGALNTRARSVKDILVQGVAWIDPANFHIVRMRTDLLEPENDPDLKQLTTESEFAPVRFQRTQRTTWLPESVTVTLKWKGWIYRNLHRYSKFQLFEVQTPDGL